MKKLLMTTVAILSLSIGIANIARADDLGVGPYLSLGAGWNHANDTGFKSYGIKDRAEYDEGWLGNAALGFAWGNNIRTEIEGAYRYNDTDKMKGLGASGGSGDYHAWTVMGNAIYDFKNGSPVTPYLGVGIGAAFEDMHDIGTAFGGTTIDKNETEFAYQGIAGIDYDLNTKSAVGLRYNYIGTAADKVSNQYSSNALLVTYRHSF